MSRINENKKEKNLVSTGADEVWVLFFRFGTPATVNVTSALGEVVVDGLSTIDTAIRNVAPDQTQRWNLTEGAVGGAGSSELGAATVTMSWDTPDFWAIGAVPMKPAP